MVVKPINKSFSKKFLRAVSSLLLTAFVCQDLAYANPEIKLSLPSISGAFMGVDLPESVARIEEVYLADSVERRADRKENSNDWSSSTLHAKRSTLIYLIQDAHTNFSAQTNISRTLAILLEKEKIKTVYLEGGFGDVSLNDLKPKADLERRKQVGMKYLRKGELSGAEYLNLTHARDFSLRGVEDEALYWRSLEVYRRVAKDRERSKEYLAKVRRAAEELKADILNPPLRTFDARREDFLDGKLSWTDYFTQLELRSDWFGIGLGQYPGLERLKNLKKKEASLDFVKANQEASAALKGLTKEEMNELSSASADPKAGRFSPSAKNADAYYLALEASLRKRSGSEAPADYPNLFQYFDYLQDAEKLDPANLVAEQRALEDKIISSLVQNDDEMEFLAVLKTVRDLEGMLDLKLLPQDQIAAAQNPDAYSAERVTGFLNRKIMDLEDHYERVMFLEKDFDEVLKSAQEFYWLTKERDEKFVTALLASMESARESKAALVTGGYHSPNLKALLKAKQVSFISVAPQVLNETNAARYEKLLLGQKSESAEKSTVITDKISLLALKNRADGSGLIAPAVFAAELGVAAQSGARLAEKQKKQRPLRGKGDMPTVQFAAKAPKISLLRAFKHSMLSAWEGTELFETPLTSSDHKLLAVLSPFYSAILSFGTAPVILANFSTPTYMVNYAALLGTIIFTYIFIKPHLLEAGDGGSVSRNAEKYLLNPLLAKSDRDLYHEIEQFEKETGWKVVWTDNPHLLAWADREQKRVFMSIGWIVASDNPSDRRRGAYLIDTLRNIRNAIEEKKPFVSSRRSRIAKWLSLPFGAYFLWQHQWITAVFLLIRPVSSMTVKLLDLRKSGWMHPDIESRDNAGSGARLAEDKKPFVFNTVVKSGASRSNWITLSRAGLLAGILGGLSPFLDPLLLIAPAFGGIAYGILLQEQGHFYTYHWFRYAINFLSSSAIIYFFQGRVGIAAGQAGLMYTMVLFYYLYCLYSIYFLSPGDREDAQELKSRAERDSAENLIGSKKSGARLSSAVDFDIYSTDGSVERMSFHAPAEAFTDVDDFISQDKRDQLKSGITQDKVKVTLVVSTYSSAAYISDSLIHYAEQVQKTLVKHPGWNIELVTSLNGQNENETLQHLLEFQKALKVRAPTIKFTILSLPSIGGKVYAMNAGAHYAKITKSDVLGFIDDDIRYTGDSLSLSIEQLLDPAAGKWLTGPRNVASLPSVGDDNPFVELQRLMPAQPNLLPYGAGQFMLMDTYPMIPNSFLNDDSYLLGYFAEKDEIENTFQRIGTPESSLAHWNAITDTDAFLSRARRLMTGNRQYHEIFLDNKNKFLDLKSRPKAKDLQRTFAEKIDIFAKLITHPTIRYGITAIFMILKLKIGMIFLKWETSLRIQIRRLLGKEPYETDWSPVRSTKLFESDKLASFQAPERTSDQEIGARLSEGLDLSKDSVRNLANEIRSVNQSQTLWTNNKQLEHNMMLRYRLLKEMNVLGEKVLILDSGGERFMEMAGLTEVLRARPGDTIDLDRAEGIQTVLIKDLGGFRPATEMVAPLNIGKKTKDSLGFVDESILGPGGFLVLIGEQNSPLADYFRNEFGYENALENDDALSHMLSEIEPNREIRITVDRVQTIVGGPPMWVLRKPKGARLALTRRWALETLGFEPGASPTNEQINAAHRKLALANHTDIHNTPQRRQVWEDINIAADILLKKREPEQETPPAIHAIARNPKRKVHFRGYGFVADTQSFQKSRLREWWDGLSGGWQQAVLIVLISSTILIGLSINALVSHEGLFEGDRAPPRMEQPTYELVQLKYTVKKIEVIPNSTAYYIFELKKESLEALRRSDQITVEFNKATSLQEAKIGIVSEFDQARFVAEFKENYFLRPSKDDKKSFVIVKLTDAVKKTDLSKTTTASIVVRSAKEVTNISVRRIIKPAAPSAPVGSRLADTSIQFGSRVKGVSVSQRDKEVVKDLVENRQEFIKRSYKEIHGVDLDEEGLKNIIAVLESEDGHHKRVYQLYLDDPRIVDSERKVLALKILRPLSERADSWVKFDSSRVDIIEESIHEIKDYDPDLFPGYGGSIWVKRGDEDILVYLVEYEAGPSLEVYSNLSDELTRDPAIRGAVRSLLRAWLAWKKQKFIEDPQPNNLKMNRSGVWRLLDLDTVTSWEEFKSMYQFSDEATFEAFIVYMLAKHYGSLHDLRPVFEGIRDALGESEYTYFLKQAEIGLPVISERLLPFNFNERARASGGPNNLDPRSAVADYLSYGYKRYAPDPASGARLADNESQEIKGYVVSEKLDISDAYLRKHLFDPFLRLKEKRSRRLSQEEASDILDWLRTAREFPAEGELLKIFVNLVYLRKRNDKQTLSFWSEALAEKWGLSAQHIHFLVDWFNKRMNIEAVSDPSFENFMRQYLSGYQKYPDLKKRFMYVPRKDVSEDEKLNLASQNMRKIEELLGNDFLSEKTFYKVSLPDSDYFIGVRFGLGESTYGTEILLGEEKGTTSPMAGVFFRIGIDTEGSSLRFVRVGGVQGKGESISRFWDAYGMSPEKILMIAAIKFARDAGLTGPVVGVHSDFLPEFSGSDLSYKKIYNQFGITQRHPLGFQRPLSEAESRWVSRYEDMDFKASAAVETAEDLFSPRNQFAYYIGARLAGPEEENYWKALERYDSAALRISRYTRKNDALPAFGTDIRSDGIERGAAIKQLEKAARAWARVLAHQSDDVEIALSQVDKTVRARQTLSPSNAHTLQRRKHEIETDLKGEVRKAFRAKGSEGSIKISRRAFIALFFPAVGLAAVEYQWGWFSRLFGKKKADWRDLQPSEGLEGAKQIVRVSGEWLKANGYPHTAVFERYEKVFAGASDSTLNPMLSKFYEKETNSYRLYINSGQLLKFFREVQKTRDESLFIQLIVSVLAAESWGLRYLESLMERQTPEKFKEAVRQELDVLLSEAIPPSEEKVKEFFVKLLVGEFIEVRTQTEFMNWASSKKGLYRAEKANAAARRVRDEGFRSYYEFHQLMYGHRNSPKDLFERMLKSLMMKFRDMFSRTERNIGQRNEFTQIYRQYILPRIQDLERGKAPLKDDVFVRWFAEDLKYEEIIKQAESEIEKLKQSSRTGARLASASWNWGRWVPGGMRERIGELLEGGVQVSGYSLKSALSISVKYAGNAQKDDPLPAILEDDRSRLEFTSYESRVGRKYLYQAPAPDETRNQKKDSMLKVLNLRPKFKGFVKEIRKEWATNDNAKRNLAFRRLWAAYHQQMSTEYAWEQILKEERQLYTVTLTLKDGPDLIFDLLIHKDGRAAIRRKGDSWKILRPEPLTAGEDANAVLVRQAQHIQESEEVSYAIRYEGYINRLSAVVEELRGEGSLFVLNADKVNLVLDEVAAGFSLARSPKEKAKYQIKKNILEKIASAKSAVSFKSPSEAVKAIETVSAAIQTEIDRLKRIVQNTERRKVALQNERPSGARPAAGENDKLLRELNTERINAYRAHLRQQIDGDEILGTDKLTYLTKQGETIVSESIGDPDSLSAFRNILKEIQSEFIQASRGNEGLKIVVETLLKRPELSGARLAGRLEEKDLYSFLRQMKDQVLSKVREEGLKVSDARLYRYETQNGGPSQEIKIDLPSEQEEVSWEMSFGIENISTKYEFTFIELRRHTRYQQEIVYSTDGHRSKLGSMLSIALDRYREREGESLTFSREELNSRLEVIVRRGLYPVDPKELRSAMIEVVRAKNWLKAGDLWSDMIFHANPRGFTIGEPSENLITTARLAFLFAGDRAFSVKSGRVYVNRLTQQDIDDIRLLAPYIEPAIDSIGTMTPGLFVEQFLVRDRAFPPDSRIAELTQAFLDRARFLAGLESPVFRKTDYAIRSGARLAARKEAVTKLIIKDMIVPQGEKPELYEKRIISAVKQIEEVFQDMENPETGKTLLIEALETAHQQALWGGDIETILAALIHKTRHFGQPIFNGVISKINKAYQGTVRRRVETLEEMSKVYFVPFVDDSRDIPNYMNLLSQMAGDHQGMMLYFAYKIHAIPPVDHKDISDLLKLEDFQELTLYQKIRRVGTAQNTGEKLKKYLEYLVLYSLAEKRGYFPSKRLERTMEKKPNMFPRHWRIAEDIRNTAFSHFFPEEDRIISADVEQFLGGRKRAEKFLQRQARGLQRYLKERLGYDAHVKSRVKSSAAIWEKLYFQRGEGGRTNKILTSLSDLSDLMGFRIVSDRYLEVFDIVWNWLENNRSGANKQNLFVIPKEKPADPKERYQGIHLDAKINYNADTGEKNFETMVLSRSGMRSYVSGGTPVWSKEGNVARFSNTVNRVLKQLGMVEQDFRTIPLLTGDPELDFEKQHEKIKDRIYLIVYRLDDKGQIRAMDVVELPRGSNHFDLVCVLQKFHLDYSGVVKASVVRSLLNGPSIRLGTPESDTAELTAAGSYVLLHDFAGVTAKKLRSAESKNNLKHKAIQVAQQSSNYQTLNAQLYYDWAKITEKDYMDRKKQGVKILKKRFGDPEKNATLKRHIGNYTRDIGLSEQYFYFALGLGYLNADDLDEYIRENEESEFLPALRLDDIVPRRNRANYTRSGARLAEKQPLSARTDRWINDLITEMRYLTRPVNAIVVSRTGDLEVDSARSWDATGIRMIREVAQEKLSLLFESNEFSEKEIQMLESSLEASFYYHQYRPLKFGNAFRRSGYGDTAYFVHVMDATMILEKEFKRYYPRIGERIDAPWSVILSAALLHDAFEDTELAGSSFDDFKKKTGIADEALAKQVYELVRELTILEKNGEKETDKEYFERMLSGNNYAVFMIKNADKLSSLRLDMESIPDKFFQETSRAYNLKQAVMNFWIIPSIVRSTPRPFQRLLRQMGQKIDARANNKAKKQAREIFSFYAKRMPFVLRFVNPIYRLGNSGFQELVIYGRSQYAHLYEKQRTRIAKALGEDFVRGLEREYLVPSPVRVSRTGRNKWAITSMKDEESREFEVEDLNFVLGHHYDKVWEKCYGLLRASFPEHWERAVSDDPDEKIKDWFVSAENLKSQLAHKAAHGLAGAVIYSTKENSLEKEPVAALLYNEKTNTLIALSVREDYRRLGLAQVLVTYLRDTYRGSTRSIELYLIPPAKGEALNRAGHLVRPMDYPDPSKLVDYEDYLGTIEGALGMAPTQYIIGPSPTAIGARLSDSNGSLAESRVRIEELEREITVNSNVLSPDNEFTKTFLKFIVSNPGIFRGKKVLDLGTGSGVLAIALARAGAQVIASDISAEAIEIAKGNVREEPEETRNRVSFAISDLYNDLPKEGSGNLERYDYVIFNHPVYAAAQDPQFPKSFMASAGMSFEVIRGALSGLPEALNPGGRAFFWALRVGDPALEGSESYDFIWTASDLKSSVPEGWVAQILEPRNEVDFVEGDPAAKVTIFSIRANDSTGPVRYVGWPHDPNRAFQGLNTGRISIWKQRQDPGVLDLFIRFGAEGKQKIENAERLAEVLRSKGIPAEWTADDGQAVMIGPGAESARVPWNEQNAIAEALTRFFSDPLSLLWAKPASKVILVDLDNTAALKDASGDQPISDEMLMRWVEYLKIGGEIGVLSTRAEGNITSRVRYEELLDLAGSEAKDRFKIYGRFGIDEMIGHGKAPKFPLTQERLDRSIRDAAQRFAEWNDFFGLSDKTAVDPIRNARNPDMEKYLIGRRLALFVMKPNVQKPYFAIISFPGFEGKDPDGMIREAFGKELMSILREEYGDDVRDLEFTVGGETSINITAANKSNLIELLLDTRPGLNADEVIFVDDEGHESGTGFRALNLSESRGITGILVGESDPALSEKVIRSDPKGPDALLRIFDIEIEKRRALGARLSVSPSLPGFEYARGTVSGEFLKVLELEKAEVTGIHQDAEQPDIRVYRVRTPETNESPRAISGTGILYQHLGRNKTSEFELVFNSRSELLGIFPSVQEPAEAAYYDLSDYNVPIELVRQAIGADAQTKESISAWMAKISADKKALHRFAESRGFKDPLKKYGYHAPYALARIDTRTGKVEAEYAGFNAFPLAEHEAAVLFPVFPSVYHPAFYSTTDDREFYRHVYKEARSMSFDAGDNLLDTATGSGFVAWISWVAAARSRERDSLNFHAYDVNPLAVATARVLLEEIAQIPSVQVKRAGTLDAFGDTKYRFISGGSPAYDDETAVEARTLEDLYDHGSAGRDYWKDLSQNLRHHLKIAADETEDPGLGVFWNSYSIIPVHDAIPEMFKYKGWVVETQTEKNSASRTYLIRYQGARLAQGETQTQVDELSIKNEKGPFRAISEILPDSPNREELSGRIVGWFGESWQEAMSLAGAELLDESRQGFIDRAVKLGLPIISIADLLNYRSFDGKVRIEDYPDEFQFLALRRAKSRGGLHRSRIDTLWGLYSLARDLDLSGDRKLADVSDKMIGTEPLNRFIRDHGEEEIARWTDGQIAGRMPISLLEGGEDSNYIYGEFFVPTAEAEPPIFEADGLRGVFAKHMKAGSPVFDLYLTDPQRIKVLEKGVGLVKKEADGSVRLGSVAYNALGAENETASIKFAQTWYHFSNRVPVETKEALGPLDELLYRSFEKAALLKGFRRIEAPTGATLFTAKNPVLGIQKTPLHRNTIERLNRIYPENGHHLTYRDSNWIWQKELPSKQGARLVVRDRAAEELIRQTNYRGAEEIAVKIRQMVNEGVDPSDIVARIKDMNPGFDGHSLRWFEIVVKMMAEGRPLKGKLYYAEYHHSLDWMSDKLQAIIEAVIDLTNDEKRDLGPKGEGSIYDSYPEYSAGFIRDFSALLRTLEKNDVSIKESMPSRKERLEKITEIFNGLRESGQPDIWKRPYLILDDHSALLVFKNGTNGLPYGSAVIGYRIDLGKTLREQLTPGTSDKELFKRLYYPTKRFLDQFQEQERFFLMIRATRHGAVLEYEEFLRMAVAWLGLILGKKDPIAEKALKISRRSYRLHTQAAKAIQRSRHEKIMRRDEYLRWSRDFKIIAEEFESLHRDFSALSDAKILNNKRYSTLKQIMDETLAILQADQAFVKADGSYASGSFVKDIFVRGLPGIKKSIYNDKDAQDMERKKIDVYSIIKKYQGWDVFKKMEGFELAFQDDPALFERALKGNERLLAFSLENAIVGAVKASSGVTERLPMVKINEDGDDLVIQVIDHGVGIPKENLIRVSDSDFTTKRGETGQAVMHRAFSDQPGASAVIDSLSEEEAAALTDAEKKARQAEGLRIERGVTLTIRWPLIPQGARLSSSGAEPSARNLLLGLYDAFPQRMSGLVALPGFGSAVLTYQVSGSRLALLDGTVEVAGAELNEMLDWKVGRSARKTEMAELLKGRSLFEKRYGAVSNLMPPAGTGTIQGFTAIDIEQVSSQIADDAVFTETVKLMSGILAARAAASYIRGLEGLSAARRTAAEAAIGKIKGRAPVTLEKPAGQVITWLSFVREGSRPIVLTGKNEAAVQVAGFDNDQFADIVTGLAAAQTASQVLSQWLDTNGDIPAEGEERKNLEKALEASPLPRVIAQFSAGKTKPQGADILDYLTNGKNASLYIIEPILDYIDRLAGQLKLISSTVDISA